MTTPATPAARNAIFISHANPTDNGFTQWLALRLACEGYEVWCDLTKLLGGSNWWMDIEQTLRLRTRRFIYIVSRASNSADGVLKELAVADGIKRQLGDAEFIIPTKIDDLPYREHNIYINGLNALNFTGSWALGLADLLRTLHEQGVPRDAAKGPRLVASWWNDYKLNREIVRAEPQKHWTNWFPIQSLPAGIWAWKVPEGSKPPAQTRWPAYQYRDRYLSFASSRELTGKDASPTGGRGSQSLLDLGGTPQREIGLERSDLRLVVKQLLRQAWDKVAEERGLPLYQLSSRRRTLWFPSGSVPTGGVSFKGMDGRTSNRQLYGFRSVGPRESKYKRFYHYGLEAVPTIYPELMMALKAHVIFTLDGNSPHRDARYQHSARRSQCKRWWNDRWRDLMAAGLAALAKGGDRIQLPLCPDGATFLTTEPVAFEAPLSYRDEDVREPAEEQLESADDSDEAAEASSDEGGKDAE